MNKKVIAVIGAGIVGAGALILMSRPPTYQAGGFAGGVSKKQGTATTETTTTETPTEPGAPIYNITFPDPGFPEIPQIDYAQILAMSEGQGETGTKKTYRPPRGIAKEIMETVRTPGMSATRTKGLIDKMRELESTKKEKTIQDVQKTVRTPGMSATRTKNLAEQIKELKRSQGTKKTTIPVRPGFGIFRIGGK